MFGPVAPLLTFKTEEEAIKIANDTNAGNSYQIQVTFKKVISIIKLLLHIHSERRASEYCAFYVFILNDLNFVPNSKLLTTASESVKSKVVGN